MRLLKTMLMLLVSMMWGITAQAQYNPADPPEPGVYFTLTARCVPADGGYSIYGTGTHAFGSNVNMRVSTSTGYRFIGWEDEDGTVVSTTSSFTYTMPAKNVDLIARFEYDPSSPAEPLTPEFKDVSYISFQMNPADGGYVSSGSAGEYEVGTSHSFTAHAHSNYSFVNWTCEGIELGTSSTLQYTVPKGDRGLVANFAYNPSSPAEPSTPSFPKTLTLKTNLEGAGSLSGAGSHRVGESFTVRATTNTYFHFVNWTDEYGDVVSESSQFTYTMPDRHVTLTANYTYNYDPSSPGEPGTPDPGGSIAENMVLWPRMGMYDDTHVQILCETPGATIHYTLDGSTPTAASRVYTEPVFVGSNLLVKAIAFKEGMEDSPVVSYQVTAYKTGIPIFTFENLKLKITNETPGAIIRYTTDFTDPNEESTVYTAPFEPEENCRIKAYASKEGLTDSPINIFVFRKADYTIPAPTFMMNDEGKLVIIPSVSGGDVRYTLDGTDPDTTSTVYSEPLTLDGNFTVRAYTVHPNYYDSPIGEYVTEGFKVASPTFSYSNLALTIEVSTPGASIRYTTDGTMPTDSATLYTEPLRLTENRKVLARGFKDHYEPSDTISYTFVYGSHFVPNPTASYGKHALTLACVDENAEIHYTVNGDSPISSSALYNAPIPMKEDCTVRFIATRSGFYDSGEETFSFVLADWKETQPTITKDFKGRRIYLENPDSTKLLVKIDGSEIICNSIDSIDVVSDMRFFEATSIASNEDRYDSDTVSDELVFHLPPKVDYDGHAVYYGPADEEPNPTVANASIFMDNVYRQGGIGNHSMDVTYMARLTAVMTSNYAFRSDSIAMDIDYYNTGREAAARNGHRISEGFRTWGSNLEDYTYLYINGGTIEKEDLEFLGFLPNLTALHFAPNFTTTEPCDSVFANSPIETLFAYSIPQGMLKGIKRLTTVMWGITNEKMPEGRLTEAGNPNILLWVFDESMAPTDAINVVTHPYIGGNTPTDPEGIGVRGYAKQITLQPGYPFGVHMPIYVENISLIKDFTLPTVIKECAGWETLTLPFDATSIRHEMAGDIVPFSLWQGPEDNVIPFWLYNATEDGWIASSSLKAGTPYIISMPNNEEYVYYYNIPGVVTFATENVTLYPEKLTPKADMWIDGIEFVGTFMPVEETGIRSLNVNLTANRDWLGSAFVEEDTTLPFGAYLRGENLPKQIPVFGDWSGVQTPASDASGIVVETPAPGAIRVSSSQDCKVAIVTPDGVTIRILNLNTGESATVEGLTRGLYICEGVKVMVK